MIVKIGCFFMAVIKYSYSIVTFVYLKYGKYCLLYLGRVLKVSVEKNDICIKCVEWITLNMPLKL